MIRSCLQTTAAFIATLATASCGSSNHDSPSPPAGGMGLLTIAVENLPAGIAAAITVSNSAGFSQVITGTQTLSGLTPDNYTITATPVSGSGTSYTPATPTQTAVVLGGGTAQGSVAYGTAPATYAAMTPGFHTRSMIVDGTVRNYQIYIPPGYNPATPQRVILFCHGSDEAGTDNAHQLGVGLGPYITNNHNVFPDVVVFPQLPFGLGDAAAGAMTAFHIYKTALDLTVAEVNTDLTRVLVTGVSAGATHTWTLAYQQPTRYAAIAPIAQWIIARRMLMDDAATFSAGPTLAYLRLQTLPVHEYWGENDANPNYSADKGGMSADPNYALIEVSGADHGGSWDMTYASAAFWTWFRAQHR